MPGEAARPPAPPAVNESGACLAGLQARGVLVQRVDPGPQPDPACTIVDPVRITEMTARDGTKIALPDRPTVACETADVFSRFVGDLLVPLARGTYGATISTVWTGPGLDCRTRDHIPGAKLSAHGQGLAVDIAQMRLTDGRLLAVGQSKSTADDGFQAAAQAGACGYFHTALGPGSDAYHRTHWHLDLEHRGAKGDTKYCH